VLASCKSVTGASAGPSTVIVDNGPTDTVYIAYRLQSAEFRQTRVSPGAMLCTRAPADTPIVEIDVTAANPSGATGYTIWTGNQFAPATFWSVSVADSSGARPVVSYSQVGTPC